MDPKESKITEKVSLSDYNAALELALSSENNDTMQAIEVACSNPLPQSN